jgi:hypothetical protein
VLSLTCKRVHRLISPCMKHSRFISGSISSFVLQGIANAPTSNLACSWARKHPYTSWVFMRIGCACHLTNKLCFARCCLSPTSNANTTNSGRYYCVAWAENCAVTQRHGRRQILRRVWSARAVKSLFQLGAVCLVLQ